MVSRADRSEPVMLSGSGQIAALRNLADPAVEAGQAFIQAARARGFTLDPGTLSGLFAASVTAWACTEFRSQVISGMPMTALDGDQPADSTATEWFLKNRSRMMGRIERSLNVWGRVYLLKLRNGFGYPTALRWLNNQDVQEADVDPITGAVRSYAVVGQRRPVPRGNMIDFSLFNPDDDLDGISPLEVAMRQITGDRALVTYAGAFFMNSARPDGILSFEGELDPKKEQEYADRWRKAFRGAANAFKTFFFSGRAKWTYTPIQPAPVDLAMPDFKALTRSDICIAFNVPPALIGIGNGSDPLSAQGTVKSLMDQFIEQVALPRVEFIAEQLQVQWLSEFDKTGRSLHLAPDREKIQASSRASADRSTMATGNVSGGIWSVNEAREFTGKPKRDGVIDFDPQRPDRAWQSGVITRNEYRKAIGLDELDTDGFIYDLDPRAKGTPPPTPGGFISSGPFIMSPGRGPELFQPLTMPAQLPAPSADTRGLPPLTQDQAKGIVDAMVAEIKAQIASMETTPAEASTPTIPPAPDDLFEETIALAPVDIPIETVTFTATVTQPIPPPPPILDQVELDPPMCYPVYTILDFANEPQLIALQAQLRAQWSGIEWTAPEDLHLTLVYATAPHACIDAMLSVLPKSINAMTVQSDVVEVWENGDSRPIVLRLALDKRLTALQQSIAAAWTAFEDCDLSDYSDPGAWQPHITLGYLAAETPSLGTFVPPTLTLTSAVLECSTETVTGDYPPLYITRSLEAVAAQLKELEQWREVVRKRGTNAAFVPQFLPEDVATYVRTNLDGFWNPTMVFGAARQWVREGQYPGEQGAEAADARDYWRAFDELEATLGTDWLRYMEQVSPAAFASLTENLHAEYRGGFDQHAPTLLSGWAGTAEAPGPLAKLLMAGTAAGQNALLREVAADPSKPRALTIEANWTLTPDQAVEFARKYGFELIRRLNETTYDDVRAVIQQALAEGWTKDQIAEALRKVLIADGTTPPARIEYRSQLIAQTEALRAFNEGAFKRWDDAGVKQATWQTVRDGRVCEVCRGLHGQVAPISVGWRSAVTHQTYTTSAHPGDRCFRRPVVT